MFLPVAQVIVAGKLRAQRAKAMKFRDGYMIKSGRVREGESLFGQGSVCRRMLEIPCVFLLGGSWPFFVVVQCAVLRRWSVTDDINRGKIGFCCTKRMTPVLQEVYVKSIPRGEDHGLVKLNCTTTVTSCCQLILYLFTFCASGT